MTAEQVILIVAIAGGIYFITRVARPKYAIRIVTIDGRVESQTGIARAKAARVARFFERDVRLNGKVVVMGARDSQGVLRIRFSGPIDEATAQQIRNYLKMEL